MLPQWLCILMQKNKPIKKTELSVDHRSNSMNYRHRVPSERRQKTIVVTSVAAEFLIWDTKGTTKSKGKKKKIKKLSFI